MPQAAKGPRLHFRRSRRDATGAVTHPAVWIIKDDGRHRQSTGCRADDRERAEQILAEYIAQKRLGATPRSARDPAQIPVADVISRYLRDVAVKTSPASGSRSAGAGAAFVFRTTMTLAQVNGDECRRYAAQRSTDAAARRELEDLRAAINHHRREGMCSQVVEVVSTAGAAGARTVAHAARRPPAWCGRRGDIARCRRAGRPTADRGSTLRSSFWSRCTPEPGQVRSAEPRWSLRWGEAGSISIVGCSTAALRGVLETKKRQPPVPLPPGLLAHLRRWKRRGQRFAVEWNRECVRDVGRAFANAGGRRGPRPRGDSSCPQAHRCHLVDAGGNRHMGGRWLPWDDGRDAVSALRASPPRSPRAREERLRAAPPPPSPPLAVNGTRTNVLKRPKNR